MNQSDGAVLVESSKQRGLQKKKIFYQMFSCARGERGRYECEMQSVVVELVCMGEGDQRYTGGGGTGERTEADFLETVKACKFLLS